ncbi:MAG TPA: ATP-grasp domain-containing protein [Terracidiphilus sp.]|nr:ATP-grasp domain-containing protein [Terracidiphilus sp.]
MTDSDQAVSGSAPKILLADTNWWANSARLAIGLAEVGCEVSAICRTPNHPLLKTRAVHRVFPYEAFAPVSALRAAIEELQPDLIVPACDRSVVHLHELYADAQVQGEAGQKMRALIERSLGEPASYSVVSSRYMLLSVAEESGVRVPRTRLVTRHAALDEWRRKEAFPWVLKADRTWGGNGVRIVRSEEEAEQSLQQLAQMSRFTRAVKRLIINRDPFWLRDWRVGSARGIIAQAYVAGKPSNCTTVCWKGKVLAAIAVQVVRSEGASGPASIVRIVEGGEMLDAARRIAARLNLSGFAGFDFVEETGTGKAYLIEMNPRIAPPCHLRLRNGRDLPGSLWAQLAERPAPTPLREPGTDLVAYFPIGVQNEIPPGCFRDIPSGEPELVAEMLNPFPDRTFFFRFAQFITHTPGSSSTSAVSQVGANDKLMSVGEERAVESERDQPV